MDDQPEPDAAGAEARGTVLEERKLQLEFERLRLERQKVAVDALLKRRELNRSGSKGWKEIFGNPLTLAIVGGFLTIMTTTVTGRFSASEGINAEAAKARQALQTDLIKKFVDNPDPQKVRANLQFLVDVGLVPDYSDSLQSFLTKAPNSALPTASNAASSALPDVYTDDDAIDLVMRFEGGYVDSPKAPELTSNHGVTLAGLTDYLGRQASRDDLRALSIETARTIYKQQFLAGAASGITSVQVKAAYLGLANNLGPVRAAKLFQTALSAIDRQPDTQESALGADIVRRINAVDPDLLIETANCGAAKYYQSRPILVQFGVDKAMIRRLRAFSPATLKGVCPELQPEPGAGSAPAP